MNGKVFAVLCVGAIALGAINHNPNDPAYAHNDGVSAHERVSK